MCIYTYTYIGMYLCQNSLPSVVNICLSVALSQRHRNNYLIAGSSPILRTKEPRATALPLSHVLATLRSARSFTRSELWATTEKRQLPRSYSHLSPLVQFDRNHKLLPSRSAYSPEGSVHGKLFVKTDSPDRVLALPSVGGLVATRPYLRQTRPIHIHPKGASVRM